PSFTADVRVVEALKARNPRLSIGMVGAHVAVDPRGSLQASTALDWVAGGEFDFTVREVAEGRPLATIDWLSPRGGVAIVHTRPRPTLKNLDLLPHVVDVYPRDLVIDDCFSGYLYHPSVSIYTGRGCKSRCTFCLWPQTIGGHRYRTRSVADVIA